MRDQVTWTPYDEMEYAGINYTNCRDYSHISRYKALRQVVHNPDTEERFVTLETTNPFTTNSEVIYYTVPATEENRLDIIAHNHLGSASYSWVIAMFNGIDDGFTIREGQVLKIPKSFYNLFNNHEILASINPLSMNLGSE